MLYSLGCQAGVVDINHAFHLYYNVVCGLSFSQSQPDFEGFLRALRFSPSAKLTPTSRLAVIGATVAVSLPVGEANKIK